jgi:hypothetical protein
MFEMVKMSTSVDPVLILYVHVEGGGQFGFIRRDV